MKGVYRLLAIVLPSVLLYGCWDQQLLKDVQIISTLGIDVTPQGKVQSTASVLNVKKTETGNSEQAEIHSVISKTLRDGRDVLNQEVPGLLTANKMNVLLLGEKVARQGIYPYIHVYYRDTRTAIDARVAVVKGDAREFVEMKKVDNKLVGEHLRNQIKALEEVTIVPKVNIQTFFPVMLDPGQDIALPYLYKKEDKIVVRGIALFDGDRMSGELNKDESILYLLLLDKKGKSAARLTPKIHGSRQAKVTDYISIDVKRVKRNMKVFVKENRSITVQLRVQLPVVAYEYARDHLNEKRVVEELNQTLSKELTEQAKIVLQKMQKANHDGLGVGRYLIAFYPDTWKTLKWSEDYAKVVFEPQVDVHIVGHGILD